MLSSPLQTILQLKYENKKYAIKKEDFLSNSLTTKAPQCLSFQVTVPVAKWI